ncbi:MAG: hypothetical protein WDA24_05270 [Tissierellales bacterium]
MSGNEQLFELMTKMYGEMQEGFKDVKGRLDKVEGRLDGVEGRLDGVEGELAYIKKTVIHIEDDHGKKLQALFDGHTQFNSQLEPIENEVTRHEEIIIRKVK